MINWELKKKIKEQFGSQAKFASVIQVPEPIISRVINGYKILSEEEKKRWAICLRCEHEKIFLIDM
jgi:hypothetical protein